MPLLLTSAMSTGDLDPNTETYTHFKISYFSLDLMSRTIKVRGEFGSMIGDEFQVGVLPSRSFEIANITPHYDIYEQFIPGANYYDEITATLPDNLDDTLYDQVATALYEWINDNTTVSGVVE